VSGTEPEVALAVNSGKGVRSDGFLLQPTAVSTAAITITARPTRKMRGIVFGPFFTFNTGCVFRRSRPPRTLRRGSFGGFSGSTPSSVRETEKKVNYLPPEFRLFGEKKLS